jgi:transposase
MIKAHKIRLHPTEEHQVYFAKAAGTARFVWNWALANDQFELGDHRIWIPKLGWVNMAENLRFQGKVTGARITKTAD